MLQPFLHPSRDELRLLVNVLPHFQSNASIVLGRTFVSPCAAKQSCEGLLPRTSRRYCVPYLSMLGSNLGKQTGRARPVPSSNARSPRPVDKRKRKHDTPSDARRRVWRTDEQWALFKQVSAVLQRAEVLPHVHFAETRCGRPVWAC